MIKKNNMNFPSPVLSPNGDDYNSSCSFELIIDESGIKVDNQSILIPVSFELASESLSELIREGKAVVAVRSKSSKASFSQLDVFGNNSGCMTLAIGKYQVITRIDIVGVVVASSPFRMSCSADLNPLYFEDMSFEIRKGDVLATDTVKYVYIDDSELEQPLTSIFTITKGEDQETKVVPDYSDEKIVISLSEDLYKLYYKFASFNRGALARFVTGIIVSPVLVEAVAIVAGQSNAGVEGCEERRWYRAIEKKAAARGLDIHACQDSPVSIADQLLGDVSYDALKRLEEYSEAEFNNGEMEIIGGVD